MHPVVVAIRGAFQDHACQADAEAVQRYMKSEQPFYGIKSPLRRKLIRAAIREHPIQAESVREAVIRDLWSGTYRDEQYAALDIAEFSRPFQSPTRWPLYVELMRSATWWDTLDWIAAKLLGPILLQEPALRKEVAPWVSDPSVWVRRAALLVHLKHRDQTDVDALAATIEALQHEDVFWIRKAIGWVLRAYGETDPDWVVAFVDARPDLAPLSKREALRKIA